MSSLVIRSVSHCSTQGSPYNRCATIESPTLSGTLYLTNRNPISTPFESLFDQFRFFISDAEAVDDHRCLNEPDVITWLGETGHYALLGRIIMLDITGEGAYFQSGELTIYLRIELFPPFSLILSEESKFYFRTRSLAIGI
ncbi:hypothetical protein [Fimbriiglobus ruber]|uniref:hypothetical protein n=1 Tax=Fimbriiglobus ruber TaxID=1908690 RepID=UPI000B4A9037|nr:hypothetical protein [Fimbriiglobus ruber]